MLPDAAFSSAPSNRVTAHTSYGSPDYPDVPDDPCGGCCDDSEEADLEQKKAAVPEISAPSEPASVPASPIVESSTEDTLDDTVIASGGARSEEAVPSPPPSPAKTQVAVSTTSAQHTHVEVESDLRQIELPHRIELARVPEIAALQVCCRLKPG